MIYNYEIFACFNYDELIKTNEKIIRNITNK